MSLACVNSVGIPVIQGGEDVNMRSEMESRLNTWLSRRPIPGTSTDAALLQPQIMGLVDQFAEENKLFIVLGSPITEVGRDHDYMSPTATVPSF